MVQKANKPPFTVAQFEAIKKIVGEAIKANAADRPLPDNAEPAPARVKSAPSLFAEISAAFLSLASFLTYDIKSWHAESVAFSFWLCGMMIFTIGCLILPSISFCLFTAWAVFGFPVSLGLINYLFKKYIGE